MSIRLASVFIVNEMCRHLVLEKHQLAASVQPTVTDHDLLSACASMNGESMFD
jgi:hypothetical protein